MTQKSMMIKENSRKFTDVFEEFSNCNMASKTTEEEEKPEKQNLADFIKSVHCNLRKQVQKANGDFRPVWEEHCQNSTLLQQYSQSMKELAVQHWKGNNLRRIEWCKDICMEYFYGGGCEKCLRKDCRRVLFHVDQHQNCICPSQAELLQLKLNSDDYQARSEKLVLLDVGSCFNPFKTFSDIFIPLAIDLCPADQSVFTCDFLSLHILQDSNITHKNSSTSPCSTSNISSHPCFPEQIQNCIEDGSTISKLPQNSFDVVAFCLLLSYLPAKEQRWQCCLKAHQLLKVNGLLIIITPDSSHQNKNMPMIKSWKAAIESIGFLRWKYHKDNHTHCMAFRKKTSCPLADNENEKAEVCPQEMLYIHQELDENFDVNDDS